MTADVKTATIRDFIYVNVEKLYSLYSQVYKGVAEEIISSIEKAITRTNHRESNLSEEKSYEESAVDLGRQTERSILYDYMYNRLEEELSEIIQEIDELFPTNYYSLLQGASLIKISGDGQIEDYDRLRLFLHHFNEIGEGLASGYFISEEHQTKIRSLEAQLKDNKNQQEKKRLIEELKKQKDLREVAKSRSLYQDEGLLAGLGVILDVLYAEGFDIILTPISKPKNIVFRGVLDKRWLRVRADLLRSLHSGLQQSNLTMVGLITHLPYDTLPVNSPDGLPLTPAELAPSEDLRDRFRLMFEGMREMDQVMFKSGKVTEIVVLPLAIYREIKIPNYQLSKS